MQATELLKQAGYEAGETVTGGNGAAPEQPFKAGDVVQVKSSGPFMTVNSVGEGRIECVWFTDSGKVEYCYLTPHCLILATTPSA